MNFIVFNRKKGHGDFMFLGVMDVTIESCCKKSLFTCI
jgi:hypothetical protein